MRVEIKGAARLRKELKDPGLVDDALRPGFQQAATIVEGAAEENAHRVTGKLQRSIGQYLEGRGFSLEAHVGPQPGLGQPARYSESDTSHWKTPRAGSNQGDPTEYGIYEELGTRYREGHPFLEPALTDNEDRIEKIIGASINKALAYLGRR